MLIATQAWRQGQFDTAEHLFMKASTSERKFDPYSAESLADILYEMGNDLFTKKNFEMSLKWLDRAHDVLASQELGILSADASELRLSIIQKSTKALIELQSPESIQRAKDLIAMLHSEIGDKLVVLLLQVELLWANVSEVFDSGAYYDILTKIIRTAVLGKENFKLIMSHIRKLADKNTALACKLLEDLLQTRVFELQNVEWAERVLITRLWMVKNRNDDDESLSSIKQLLDSIVVHLRKPISVPATHAAQMVGLPDIIQSIN
jgi:tetratricopeptide (TPR) repeat protein